MYNYVYMIVYIHEYTVYINHICPKHMLRQIATTTWISCSSHFCEDTTKKHREHLPKSDRPTQHPKHLVFEATFCTTTFSLGPLGPSRPQCSAVGLGGQPLRVNVFGVQNPWRNFLKQMAKKGSRYPSFSFLLK